MTGLTMSDGEVEHGLYSEDDRAAVEAAAVVGV